MSHHTVKSGLALVGLLCFANVAGAQDLGAQSQIKWMLTTLGLVAALAGIVIVLLATIARTQKQSRRIRRERHRMTRELSHLYRDVERIRQSLRRNGVDQLCRGNGEKDSAEQSQIYQQQMVELRRQFDRIHRLRVHIAKNPVSYSKHKSLRPQIGKISRFLEAIIDEFDRAGSSLSSADGANFSELVNLRQFTAEDRHGYDSEFVGPLKRVTRMIKSSRRRQY